MDADPLDRTSRPWWVLGVALMALAVAAWLLATMPAAPPDPAADSPMMQVAPGGEVTLASLPADHQALYTAAHDDPAAFSEVACWCGCEAFLDHRHLLDCFVRPDGTWERHATGCAVCLAEARDVIELRDEDVPVAEIIRRIDRRYGGITDPSAA